MTSPTSRAPGSPASPGSVRRPHPATATLATLAAMAAVIAGLTLLGGPDAEPAPQAVPVDAAVDAEFAAGVTAGVESGADTRQADLPPVRPAKGPRVLAISIDGLHPTALRRLGRDRAPHLHRLLTEGASTLNARAQVEQTVTLPNHTSMVTGRRIDARHRGHGVTWNDDLAGTTVQGASGDDAISSVFEVVRAAGWSSALFATKSKFSLFQRSWPSAVTRSSITTSDAAAVSQVRRDLARRKRAFTFLHLGGADVVGHARGWLSRPYLRAVRTVDALVGEILADLDAPDAGRSLRRLRIVLTADHGGIRGTTNHVNAAARDDYRIPFLIWGKGVDAGDLYAFNPESRQPPGRGRPRFAGTQPVRNGEVANVALDLLGLGHVPGSRWDRFQDLAWTAPSR